MEVRFEQGPNWVIEADLGTAFEGFNDTLSDAVSTMPPRGSADDCPSTYWIDRALEGVETEPHDSNRAFLEGNATALYTDGKLVRAHSLYEIFTDEVMSIADFVDVMRRWRDAVGAARQEGRRRQTNDVYKRNPWPPVRKPTA